MAVGSFNARPEQQMASSLQWLFQNTSITKEICTVITKFKN